MAYTTFEHFVEKTNNRLVNENVDKIVGTIVESQIPFDVFYTECLLPVLLESNSSDPLELISEVGNWFQRNMPTFSKMFGKGTKPEAPAPAPAEPSPASKPQYSKEEVSKMLDNYLAGRSSSPAPAGPSPEEQANANFQAKYGETFKKVKDMFMDSLKKAATELQHNVSRYPNAKMLVPAIQALVNNAAQATQGYQFRQGKGSNDFFNKFTQAGQQNAILKAISSGNTKGLLSMPDEQIINAVQGQPEMRQQLTQLAKGLQQQVQAETDPDQKQNLQGQLKRVLQLTKFGMGKEYIQRAALGKSQRAAIDKINQEQAANKKSQAAAAQLAKEREAFNNRMFDQLMNNPNPNRRPQNDYELNSELDRLWKDELKKRNKAAGGNVYGGSQPVPAAPGQPAGVSSMSYESVDHGHKLLVESLIRCVGPKK